MGAIIEFDHAPKKRGENMYEELVRNLEESPATNYVVRDAEKLADQVLMDGNYFETVGPVPVVKIVKAFGFEAYTEPNIPKDISGNIFIGGTTKKVYDADKVIIVGDDEVLAHQRFIIAHELGHYLMDYIGNMQYADNKKLFSKAYQKENHDSSEELRADRFAAELLMPKVSFKAKYINAMKRYNYDQRLAVSYLASFFEVKESCIIRRISEVME